MEEEYRIFCIKSIDSVEYKIKRKADIMRGRLHQAMQELGNTLLYTMRRVSETGIDLLCTAREVGDKGLALFQLWNIADKGTIASLKGLQPVRGKKPSPRTIGNGEEASNNPAQENAEDGTRTAKDIHEEEERKNKMVAYASTIGMIEDQLIVHLVKLMENILGLARSAYEDSNPYRTGSADLSRFDGGDETEGDAVDGVPLGSACGEAGEEFEGTESAVSVKIEKLAKFALFRESTDRDVIETCYELVMGVCDMENDAVTKIEWKELPDEEHPRGMIGHTYNILRCYDWKTGDDTYTYSHAFKKQFRSRANEYLQEANALRKDAFESKTALSDTPNLNNTKNAIENLNCAISLLQKASDLIKEASIFPNDPPGL